MITLGKRSVEVSYHVLQICTDTVLYTLILIVITLSKNVFNGYNYVAIVANRRILENHQFFMRDISVTESLFRKVLQELNEGL